MMIIKFKNSILLLSKFTAFFLILISSSLHAEILGTSLRIWTTEPGQKSTSAYMILTSSKDVVLTNITSPISKQAAIFRTVRIGDTLRMKMMERVPLAAGHSIDFTAEGYQLILSGLNHKVRVGETIPITLEFIDQEQRRQSITLSLTGHLFNE